MKKKEQEMDSTALEVMKDVRNYFIKEKLSGRFVISAGRIGLSDEYPAGTKCLVTGSYFNDGLHTVWASDFEKDEEFDGHVFIVSPPADFWGIVKEIKAYAEKNPQEGVTSESFGGYSYSISGGAKPWREVFGPRLNKYRKMIDELCQ